MPVSLICCDWRRSCHHGDPPGGTCPGQGTSQEKRCGRPKGGQELRAEQAAHRQSEDKIAKMAVELKDAADRYELLEKESQAKAPDLKKAMVAAKETRSKIKATKEELRQAGNITAG